MERYFEDLFGVKIPEAKTFEEKEWKAIKLRAFMQTEYHYYLDQFNKEASGSEINLAKELIYFDYLNECRDMTKKDILQNYSKTNNSIPIQVVEKNKQTPKNMLELFQKEKNAYSVKFSGKKIKKVLFIEEWYLYGFYKIK